MRCYSADRTMRNSLTPLCSIPHKSVLVACDMRDGWNLQWAIMNRPPDSNNSWRQWTNVSAPPWVLTPTALAECDELSAL